MGEFRKWLEEPRQINEMLGLFKPNKDPEGWTKQKRNCGYCGQPVRTMGSYSEEEARWAKCMNPQCPSQAKTSGLLEPDETTVGGVVGKIGQGIRSAAASIM